MGGPMGRNVDVWKYARPEFERRFLLSAIPTGRVLRRRHIVDRYFIGTGLRLRALSSDTGDHTYKLTQKIPEAMGGARGRITTMYLPPVAYALLSELPGANLCKTRLSVPPFGIDIFEGALDRLVLAECEAETAADVAEYSPPKGAVAEVTEDERFTGGRLATTTAEELSMLLQRFGI
jgi:CYTH domain-containing protein